MHELALARDLLAAVQQTLGAEDAKVMRVNVIVGSAAGIVPESLRFAFEALIQGTHLAGAQLSVTTVSSQSRCAGCSMVFDFDGLIGRCPRCGRLGGELMSGDEMILQAIEVADV